MTAKIVGIGNSSGIIIPSSLLSALNLKKNDPVLITETARGFEVRPVEKPKSLSELLEQHYGKPVEEAIELFKNEEDDVEIDWGPPVGKEIW